MDDWSARLEDHLRRLLDEDGIELTVSPLDIEFESVDYSTLPRIDEGLLLDFREVKF